MPTTAEWIGVIVGVLVVALFLHLAAKFVAAGAKYTQSIIVAVVAGLLAVLSVAFIAPLWLGQVVAVIAFMAVAGAMYRIGWIRALILGVIAWVLWIVTSIAVTAVTRAIQGS